MQARHPRLIAVLFGIRHLFGFRYWTPHEYRRKLTRWPEDCALCEDEIAALLQCWCAQQQVAWLIARLLAWTMLAGGLLRLAGWQ